MSDVDEFQCKLLGTVEVTRSMAPLGPDERLKMAQICHTAIVKKAIAVRDRSWLLRPQHFSEGVSLEIDQKNEEIALYNGEYLICRHPIPTMTIMVILDDSNPHLVYIGHCSKDDRRLGVVISFSSSREVISIVKMYKKIKRKTSPKKKDISSDSIEEDQKYVDDDASQADKSNIYEENHSNHIERSSLKNNSALISVISRVYEEKHLEYKGKNMNKNVNKNVNKNEYKNEEYLNDDTEEISNLYMNPTIVNNVQPELPSRNKSGNNFPNDPTRNRQNSYEGSKSPSIPTTTKPSSSIPTNTKSSPSIPTTPKPSPSLSTIPKPSQAKNVKIPKKTKNVEDDYINDDEESNTENIYVGHEYVNDEDEKNIYQNPESLKIVQKEIPARNTSNGAMKPKSSSKGQKGGFFQKLNKGSKKDKSTAKTGDKESKKVKNTTDKKTKHEPIQSGSGRRPLPALPAEKDNIENYENDDDDDDDSIYEDSNKYSEDQGRLYMKHPK